MAITPLPTPPTRSDPASFSARGDAFMSSLSKFQVEANALAAAMNLNSTTDTSSTSNTIGIGSKTFTVASGKSFQPGMYLVVADTAAPSTNSMSGQVTSYTGTSLVLNVLSISGSGTKTSWTISLTGPVVDLSKVGLQSNGTGYYTTSATLTSADFGRAAVYDSDSAATLTLPTVTGNSGKIITLTSIGTGLVTLASSGAASIVARDAVLSSITLTSGESLGLVSDGINWVQVWGTPYALRSSGYFSYTTSATLTAADFGRLCFYNSVTAGAFTLPSVTGAAGKIISIYNLSSGVLTISRAGTSTIYAFGLFGATSVKLNPGESVALSTDGTSWIQAWGSQRAVGVGQTWQSVLASRALSTTYTNSTGAPIEVAVSGYGNNTASYSTMEAYVNGVQIATSFVSDASASWLAAPQTIILIVPNGATYKIDNANAGVTLSNWSELR